MRKGNEMSVLHETVAHKYIQECKQFKEYTNNLIKKNNCYNEMQRYSNQLNEAMKEFKYCLVEVLNRNLIDITTINKRLEKHVEKIEKILTIYRGKIDGFKKARKEHSGDFVKLYDELMFSCKDEDLLEEDFQYCSFMLDEAMCELAIAKNKYDKVNAEIMQKHIEIKNIMKELENRSGLVIEYKLCSVPMFFKELKTIA